MDIVDEFELELPDLGLDPKEFGSETVSYMITHRLERFPELDEEVCFNILDDSEQETWDSLCFRVIEIEDSTMWKVEVKRKRWEDNIEETVEKKIKVFEI